LFTNFDALLEEVKKNPVSEKEFLSAYEEYRNEHPFLNFDPEALKDFYLDL
jgi:hypothetical protein